MTHVQTPALVTQDATSTTIAQTFGSAVVAGNRVCVAVAWGDGSTNWPTVTDNLGNTYVRHLEDYDAGNQQGLATYSSVLTTGGTCTVTATFGTTTTFRRFGVSEHSGCSGAVSASSKNKVASGSPTTTDGVTSGSGTTTADGCTIFGVRQHDNAAVPTVTAGTGFTMRVNNNDFSIEDQAQASAGSVAATFTVSGAEGYLAQMVAFAPGATDPGPGEVRLTGSAGAELIAGTSTVLKLSSLLDALEPRAHLVKETPGQVFAATLTISGLAATANNHGVLLLLHQSQAITSVVDNLGAAWSVAGDQSTGVEGRVGIWYREDLPAGVTSVTITAAASAALIADVVEISGDVTFRGATVGAYGSIANPAAVTVANAPDGAIVLSVAGYFNAARGETIPADYAKLGHPGMSIATTHFLASFKELAAAENPAGPDYGARADATNYTNFGSVTAVFGP